MSFKPPEEEEFHPAPDILGQSPPSEEQFYVILCRFVVILFDRSSQARLLTYLQDHLIPKALSFVGHFESLTGVNQGLTVRPAIHQA